MQKIIWACDKKKKRGFRDECRNGLVAERTEQTGMIMAKQGLEDRFGSSKVRDSLIQLY